MNSANGGNIIYHFKGDTSQLDSSIKNTKSSFGSMTKAMLTATGITKAVSAGFNLISSNMDGAIKRFDTLNQFPKVMSNLGISTDESSQAIKKMAERLSGLPTTLDQGAMAVQRFTSANGDVKKSTDIFLALNNAIIAGGAGAEIQSSALEQLSQAYAKGKMDMMEWRTIQTAMPAQLKQIAQAMGVSTEELGEMMRQGDNTKETMEKFMDTIVQLNETGIEGFANFEEQARGATGGIGTSITVMKTRVAQGITEMITAIDKGMQDNGLGKLSDLFVNIGNAIKSALIKLAPFVVNTIGFLTKEIPKVVDFLKMIAPILAPIIIGFTTFFGILKLMSIIKAITAGFAMFNAVLMANPIVAIIAGVVALVAAIVLLYNKCEWFRNLVGGIFSFIGTTIGVIVNIIKGIIDVIVNVMTAIWNVIKPIVDFIKNYILLIIAALALSLEAIYNAIKPVVDWVWNNVLQPIVNFVSNAFNTVKNIIVGAASVIKGIFDSIANAIKGAFNTVKNAVLTVFNAIKSTVSNIFHTIGNIIKAPINGIISGINAVLSMINKIKVPDWVPVIGGKGIHFNLIPKLATGTNNIEQEGLYHLHQGEAVVPKRYNPATDGLGYIQDRIDSLMGGFGVGSNVNPNSSQVVVNVQNNIEMDPLGQLVNKVKTFSGGAKNDYNWGSGL